MPEQVRVGKPHEEERLSMQDQMTHCMTRAPASMFLTGRKLTHPEAAPILGKHYRHY